MPKYSLEAGNMHNNDGQMIETVLAVVEVNVEDDTAAIAEARKVKDELKSQFVRVHKVVAIVF